MKVLSKLWDGIAKKLKSTKPKTGDVFACTTGDFLGEFFIYMESTETEHMFLSLPKMEPRNVPFDKYELAIEEGFLEKVETLPGEIQTLCYAQYRNNTNSE